MLVPMPVDIDSSKYINEFISMFQAVSKKIFTRSAYKSGVDAITKHHGMMNAISEDGNYWNVLDLAVEKDFIFRAHNCLSEVLMDTVIREIVPLMFGARTDLKTWPDPVKTYAFGN